MQTCKKSGFVNGAKRFSSQLANGGRRALRRGATPLLAGGLVVASTVGSAHAEGENAGVAAIKTAIDALKPDMGTIVLAAVAVALVGIGAGIAMSLGKKLMGR